MKRVIYFLSLYFILSQTSAAQQIKVESGISYSSLKDINFNRKIHSCYSAVSVCLLERKWFDVYGGIGLLTRGGRDEIPYTTEEGETIDNEQFSLRSIYLTPNVTFNLKYRHENLTLYLGTGPRIDICLNTKYVNIPSECPFFTAGKVTKSLYGANCACGGYYLIGNFQLGINFIHYFCFNRVYTGLDGLKKKDCTFALTFSLGFHIRNKKQ